MAEPARIAVLTVSSSRKLEADGSGDALERLIGEAGHVLVERAAVTDERGAIAAELARLSGVADVVLTTGGTGLTVDDVTPDATADVVDREVPGIAEAIRAASIAHTPMAMLSRATAGTRGTTLIVNLPGSTRACEQCFPTLEPVLAHARALLAQPPGPATTTLGH